MADNGPVVVEAPKVHDFGKTLENGKMQQQQQPQRQNVTEAQKKYINELLTERAKLESNFPLAVKLIDEALERVHLNGRAATPREQYADVYQQRTIKLTQKVYVPTKDKRNPQNPQFNFVGKLLGPKGNSLRRLQEETQCKIVILGRSSMKDSAREEELRNSAEAKYAHLNLPLHVEVSTVAPPAEAYARVAYALAELRRYLSPDKHDDIRQEQYRELMGDPETAKKIRQQRQQANGSNNGGGSGGGGGGNGGGGNYRGNNSSGGGYPRSRYQGGGGPNPQHYHNGDSGVGYYRNSAPHGYRSGDPLPRSMRDIYVSPPRLVRPPPIQLAACGVPAPLTAYNGRIGGSGAYAAGGGLLPSSNGSGGANASGGGGGSQQQNSRYRPSLPPYQYAKK